MKMTYLLLGNTLFVVKLLCAQMLKLFFFDIICSMVNSKLVYLLLFQNGEESSSTRLYYSSDNY